MNFSVIGGGSWGSAFARYLGTTGKNVTLWVREKEVFESLLKRRENQLFLKGFKFPKNVQFTKNITEAVDFGEIIFVAVPSKFCRPIYRQMVPYFDSNKILVSLTKGFDPKTLKTMTGLIEEIFNEKLILPPVALSGPSFAKEVAAGLPTAVVCASKDIEIAKKVQHQISSLSMRVYASSDVIGVETGGALKNIIAIAAGIIDSLGLGYNTRAALITRGLVEIARLGMALGARRETFAGLAGVGDLILTCTAEMSRNYQLGMEIGRGKSLKEIVSKMKMVAEGIHATICARKLAEKTGVEMPITEEVYRILYRGKNPKNALIDLMSRKLKEE